MSALKPAVFPGTWPITTVPDLTQKLLVGYIFNPNLRSRPLVHRAPSTSLFVGSNVKNGAVDVPDMGQSAVKRLDEVVPKSATEVGVEWVLVILNHVGALVVLW